MPFWTSEVAKITLEAKWRGERKRLEEEKYQREEHSKSQDLIKKAQVEAMNRRG